MEVLILIVWIVLSGVAGAIAGNKGRSGVGFFLLSLILSPLAALAGETIEFKGVPFGASEAELLQLHPSAKCNAPKERLLVDRYCFILVSYGGAEANVAFSLIEDKVVGATAAFASREFDDVLRALTDQYGTPKIDRQTVRNRLGAEFENVTARWDLPDQELVIRAQRYSGSLDTARVMFETHTLRRKGISEIEKSRKKRASDL